jgi:hypothetical protein
LKTKLTSGSGRFGLYELAIDMTGSLWSM